MTSLCQCQLAQRPILPPQISGKERDETNLDYFGTRYFSGALGRWTSPDRPFLDQYPTNPQSWNLYNYARNNPLKYIDPTGEAVQLMGETEEEREKELEAIKAALVKSDKAKNLTVNPELDKAGKATGRYFVDITGDKKAFASAGDLEAAMFKVIDSDNIVEFAIAEKVTKKTSFIDKFFKPYKFDVGAKYGGAVTYGPSLTLSGNIGVTIDPNDIRSGRSDAPTPTLGEAVAHELLGHALGLARNPEAKIISTNRMAVEAENAARKRGGTARGLRTKHKDGFPAPQMPW
jgi:RHS repeat-associated protein